MSALSGLAGGVIPTVIGGGSPTHFFRGMGFTPPDLHLVADAAQARAGFNGSVFVDSVGRVIHADLGTIAYRVGGLPHTATGALCTEAAAVTAFDQGVGFTATGRVAIS